MLSFAQRLAVAAIHEAAVLNALRQQGWDAEPFGQGQLTERMREHLRRHTVITPLRWIPDIIAARTLVGGRSHVVYIDAKGGSRWQDTGNHDVETAALATAETWSAWTKSPTYFVFCDWSVATPELVRSIGRQGPPPHYGNGTGTPYLIFPASACTPFGDVFADSRGEVGVRMTP